MATIDTIADRSTGTALAGKAYFETSTNKFIVFNGTAWIELDSDGTGAVFENRWGASFDGSDDRLLTSNTPIMFNDMANGYTFSCWSYRDDDPNLASNGGTTSWYGGPLASADTSHAYPLCRWYLTDEYWNGGAYNMIRWYHNQTHNASITSIVVPKGSWFHLAATWDGASTVTTYLNGSQIAQNTSAPPVNTALTHKMLVGKGHFWNQSKIDEVAYFNTGLSAADITKIYNGTAPNGKPTDLTLAASYDTDRTSNLKGYWRMGDDSNDSPSSDPTSNSIATITDSSGNGNDLVQATASRQPTFKALDQSTTSLSFDGSTDYLSAPTITALNAPAAFSSSAWFAYSGSTTASAENIITAGSASGNRFYLQVFNPQNIRYGHSTAYLDISVSTLNSGTWYHLATVHNGTSLEVFLNGVSQGTASVNAPQSGYGTNFKIGAYAVGGITPIGHFEGALDDVAIFNTVLSASEVASLAASRGAHIVNDLSLSPTAYYRMGEDDSLTDGASVSQITDASGNGNHALQATAANQPTASIDPVIYV